jgi:Ca-activated chloride channel family protein
MYLIESNLQGLKSEPLTRFQLSCVYTTENRQTQEKPMENSDRHSVISPLLLHLCVLVWVATALVACTQHGQSEKSSPKVVAEPSEKHGLYSQASRLLADEAEIAPESGLADRKRATHTAKAPSMINLVPAENSIPQGAASSIQTLRAPSEPINRENYAHFDDHGIKRVTETPVSTFSIDVDTGSYSNVRRMLNSGLLPIDDAVRAEELINYFSYDYAASKSSNQPFSVITEIGAAPWNPEKHILHIGIKGYDLDRKALPASNLVFLVDVSGSMQSADKLGLLKSALKLLGKQMRREDQISIVVYAGASGVVLESAAGNETAKINQALDALSAGGRTNGAAGIRTAYQLAQQSFIKDGINRVILATDGDFNVGTVNFEALKNLIEEKRKSGISLTTLGFGTGNYNDHLMEQLADAGNGNYAYIDNLNEAQKVLVDEMSSTLHTIAKDVKIQIEFNPTVVAEYRLIGYENRVLEREDFNNDKVDAGEIGAGHSVTALYEINLVTSNKKSIDPLRYADTSTLPTSHRDEIALLRLRYKQPESANSRLIEHPIRVSEIVKQADKTSDNFRFSAAVAGFAQLLRGGKYTDDFSFDNVLQLARQARGDDPFGYRGEFISLVNLANTLQTTAVEK